MARRYSPFLRSVTLTTANVSGNLLTLLQALDSEVPTHVQSVSIQLDVGAGSARLYVGDPDNITTTHVGAELVATQAWSTGSHESNLIHLGDIQLMSDTNSIRCNISFITR